MPHAARTDPDVRLYRIRLSSRVDGTGVRGLGGPSGSGTRDDDACETPIRYCARDVVCHHQLPATGRLPSTTSAAGQGRLCSALHRYYAAVRLLASSAAASPIRASCRGPGSPWRLRARRGLPEPAPAKAGVPTRSFRAWCGPRPRRDDASCIARTHMLPSTLSTASAPATFSISWLTPTPHTIAVYASWPRRRKLTQHSLPGGRYPLPRLSPGQALGRTSTGWIAPASPGAFRKRESRAEVPRLSWTPAFAWSLPTSLHRKMIPSPGDGPARNAEPERLHRCRCVLRDALFERPQHEVSH